MNGYAGKKPKKSEGWSLLHKFRIDGGSWEIFQNPSKGYGDWIMLKLIRTGGTHRKANFTTAYNPVEKRMSATRCLDILINHHPNVAHEVCVYLVDQYQPE